MTTVTSDYQAELERLREQALQRLPPDDSQAFDDVRQVRDLVRSGGGDAAVVYNLHSKWQNTTSITGQVFCTRLALALWRAGWSHARRYQALKNVGANDEAILDAYMNQTALDACGEKEEWRLNEFDALREGLLVLAECGDDSIIVNTLYRRKIGDPARLLATLEDILGWVGADAESRITQVLYFRLGWSKDAIRRAWKDLDELRKREIEKAMPRPEEEPHP